ncbi:hypothetical protein H6P81_021395 [Aristolochia fimbriata]|uniref:Uncharacterized protein n=1 Tax=Aristolochia fimbriata TaxID=158543 RepID=A0AAV7DQ40_ARIFI|nr:hypothetical protein H6P81_021395 [Aristolochia fimbriata]
MSSPATDHRLGKLLPHQLANQTRAPPRADSSFCSSAYGVLQEEDFCSACSIRYWWEKNPTRYCKKKERKQNQVKMIRINPFLLRCTKDLTSSEGTGAISFQFPFKSSYVFPRLLRPRKMDKFLFLGTHTRFVTTKG